MAQLELSIRTLGRNGWIVAGTLLLAVGIGDVVASRTKLAQYHEVLAQPVVTLPKDPAILFPKASEAEEQRAVAYAKLGFYNLLFLAGQVLTFGGLVLGVIGLARLRVYAPIEPSTSGSR